ncbi:MAG: DUF6686 family protein [Bacteroidota bacterium]|nr:hypothetical protein [Ferruginibacter sp.]
MCEFESLYFSDDGYVVRCKETGHYQVAFMSTILTLTEVDFQQFCKLIRTRSGDWEGYVGADTRCVVIPTPAQGINLLFTKKEALQFNNILEEADTENRALSLMRLFKM